MGGFFLKSNQSYVFCSFAVAKATGGKWGNTIVALENMREKESARERARERERESSPLLLPLSLSLQSWMEGVTEPVSGKVY